jgi:hypothetical protein
MKHALDWYTSIPLLSQCSVLLLLFLAALQIGYHAFLLVTLIFKRLQLLILFIRIAFIRLIPFVSRRQIPSREMIPCSSEPLTLSDLNESVHPLADTESCECQIKPKRPKLSPRTQPRDESGRFVRVNP